MLILIRIIIELSNILKINAINLLMLIKSNKLDLKIIFMFLSSEIQPIFN